MCESGLTASNGLNVCSLICMFFSITAGAEEAAAVSVKRIFPTQLTHQAKEDAPHCSSHVKGWETNTGHLIEIPKLIMFSMKSDLIYFLAHPVMSGHASCIGAECLHTVNR